jgi:hypothetical protein
MRQSDPLARDLRKFIRYCPTVPLTFLQISKPHSAEKFTGLNSGVSSSYREHRYLASAVAAEAMVRARAEVRLAIELALQQRSVLTEGRCTERSGAKTLLREDSDDERWKRYTAIER